MHYLIYKITNKLNNKIYVGKHKTENKNDDYLGSGTLLVYAIKKYGKENFIKEILFECASLDEMNLKEIDIVDEEFVSRLDTYNIRIGGEGGWSEENRKKGPAAFIKRFNEDEEFRIAHQEKSRNILEYFRKNNTHPWIGRSHTDDTKKKMSDARKGKVSGKNNPSFGTMWINNGTSNLKIAKTSAMPDGYKKGRLIQVLPK